MHIWKTLDREVALDRQPYLRVVRESVEVAPGQVIPDFWQVILRDFSLVVPVMEDGRILMQRSYRHGPRRICLGFPGGFVDEGETPKAAALREMAEESALRPGQLLHLGSFIDNGNQRGCEGHYYLALGCRVEGTRALDPAEAVEDCPMTTGEVEAALDDGCFGVAHYVTAWLLARRRLDRLRA